MNDYIVIYLAKLDEYLFKCHAILYFKSFLVSFHELKHQLESIRLSFPSVNRVC